MISRPALLKDLQKLLGVLHADLIDRARGVDMPELRAALLAEHAAALAAERTAQNQVDWIDDAATQMAAIWVLSCVFVRFLEDNRLIDPPRISGPGERLTHARDEHEAFFRQHPTLSDRDYLLHVFDDLAGLPGGRDVFGPHNGLRWLPHWLSPDGARALLEFFQKIDPATGNLRHDFTDADWGTRFLGDLYQDLSDEAKKRYALLQTPDFVESFILDRTLKPALEEFGLRPAGSSVELTHANCFRIIDPACGSGHFLLGAFPRILDRWFRAEPDTNPRELVRRTLLSIHGVDINPFAAAIARFRLLLAALRACGIARLADAPAFHVNVEAGDSLLHGTTSVQGLLNFGEFGHYYRTEDPEELKHILVPGAYHAVVANPPYITVKDKAQNQAYRDRYGSCSGKYSLSVPFMERIFNLAVRGERGGGGHTGQITSNAFMKRGYGKQLIEDFIPRWDLSHVIDTSGAYIPGHGTPTVILLGRNQLPVQEVVRSVLGIRGEPSSPEDPAKGLVWSSIMELVDRPGEQSDFVSSCDTERASFHSHPWSIGGGGAAELKLQLDGQANCEAAKVVDSIGITSFTLCDDVYLGDTLGFRRQRVSSVRAFLEGEQIRDWGCDTQTASVFPYDDRMKVLPIDVAPVEYLWGYRTVLANNFMFGKQTKVEAGLAWYEYGRLTGHKLLVPLSITFSNVATHNHFVLDRGGKVFNSHAPVIKLPAGATEADHLPLLGLLNSSTACFWMKQVFYPKGGDPVGTDGARVSKSPWEDRYEFDGTKLKQFPIPATKPLALPRELDRLAQALKDQSPEAALSRWQTAGDSLLRHLAEAEQEADRLRGRMIALQEELDWECYRHYGLTEESLIYIDEHDGQDKGKMESGHGPDSQSCLSYPSMLSELRIDAQDVQEKGKISSGRSPDDSSCLSCSSMLNTPSMSISLGQRAFEIVLARQVAAGDEETTWFARHAEAGSQPITEIPSEWPASYRALVERRIAKIESDPNIKLIEKPEFKRRWNTEPWAKRQQEALRQWLLLRMEQWFDFDGRMKKQSNIDGQDGQDKSGMESGRRPESPSCSSCPSMLKIDTFSLVSLARLADWASSDAAFQEAARVYTGDPAFKVLALIEELVSGESVPFLPVLRYAESGLRKRAEWERTWALQRREDAIAARNKLAKDDPRYLDAFALKDQIAAEVGTIPVPPKYATPDFQKTPFWKLRGKLDVPKERWVTFPGCPGSDGTLMVAWAGYNHVQLAQAVAGHYVHIEQDLGGSGDSRLEPLLAALVELLPWLKQWHNDIDPLYNERMGDFYEAFIQEKAREMGRTVEEVKGWKPAEGAAGKPRGRRKKG